MCVCGGGGGGGYMQSHYDSDGTHTFWGNGNHEIIKLS